MQQQALSQGRSAPELIQQAVTMVWTAVISLELTDIVSLVSLIIALAALKVANQQKLLDIMASRSGALLTNWETFPTDDPSSILLMVSHEARGPVPFYDVRLCIWDGHGNLVQLAETHSNVVSSTELARVTAVSVDMETALKGFIGIAWSEPHQHNLITKARRWRLVSTGEVHLGELWKWTPRLEKITLGRVSGRWKSMTRPWYMRFSRQVGPTIGESGPIRAEVQHSGIIPPLHDLISEMKKTPEEESGGEGSDYGKEKE